MQKIANKLVYDSVAEMVVPSRCALLIVDMQNEFCSPKGIPGKAGIDVSPVQKIIPPVQRLLAAARAASVRVIFFRQSHEKDLANVSPARLSFYAALYAGKLSPFHAIRGTWGHEIIPELEPIEGEHVINKDRSSGFIATNLDLLLRSNKIETVVITGMATHACVESTARDAGFFDYYAVLATDGVADYSAELHNASLLTLKNRCYMSTTAELIGLWSGATKVSNREAVAAA